MMSKQNHQRARKRRTHGGEKETEIHRADMLAIIDIHLNSHDGVGGKAPPDTPIEELACTRPSENLTNTSAGCHSWSSVVQVRIDVGYLKTGKIRSISCSHGCMHSHLVLQVNPITFIVSDRRYNA